MYQKTFNFNVFAAKYLAINIICACAIGTYLPSLPSKGIVCLTISLSVVAIVLTINNIRESSLHKFLFIHSLVFVLMLGNFILHAHHKKSQQLNFKYAQQHILIRAEIINFTKYQHIDNLKITSLHVRVMKAVEGTNNQLILQRGAVLKLKCYGCNKQFKLGETWQVLVKLKPPKGSASWGAFDFEKYALANNIAATGYFTENSARLISSKISLLNSIRRLIRLVLIKQLTINQYHLDVESSDQVLSQQYKNSRNLALLQALILGDRSGLNSEQWRLFRETGTSHLIAISGLHITLVFFMVSFLARKLLNGFLRVLPTYLTRQIIDICFKQINLTTFSMLIGLIFAFLYALLAGFSLPTQRAVLMLGIFCVCKLFNKQLSLFDCLCLGVIFLLILFPTSTLHIGFWLSFIAILVIVVLLKSRESKVLMHLRMALTMMPFTLLIFNQASVISPLVNVMFIPLVAVLILPISLIMTFVSIFTLNQQTTWLISLIDFLWWILNGFLNFFWQGLIFFSKLQVQSIGQLPSVSSTGLFIFFLILLISLLLFWRFVIGRYLLLLPLILVFYFGQESHLQQGEFVLINLDVGQGLAVLIETQQYFVVFDTGNAFIDSDSAQHTIIPYLRRNPHKTVHTIVVSHADKDHIGGLQSLLKATTATELLINDVKAVQNQTKLILSKQHNQQLCYAQSWQINGVVFKLFPEIDDSNIKGMNRNNSSCVMKVISPYGTALLPGDIERSAEHYLVDKYEKNLASDILLVPHHGSNTSSTAVFLNAVKPKHAIISTAYFSPYKHPHKNVLKRLEKYSDEVLSTAISGSIKFIYSKDGILKREYRALHPRFWYSQPHD